LLLSQRERKRERKVSFGGAKQKKSVHLLVFYDNNDVSRLIIEMYTYTHSSEKMVIFASFFALPTMAALLPSPPLCVNKNQSRVHVPLSTTHFAKRKTALRHLQRVRCVFVYVVLSSDRAIFESSIVF
jgi:hypothetical protein